MHCTCVHRFKNTIHTYGVKEILRNPMWIACQFNVCQAFDLIDLKNSVFAKVRDRAEVSEKKASPSTHPRPEQLKSKSGTCGAAKRAGTHSAPRLPGCRAKSCVLGKGLAPRLQGATIFSLPGLPYVQLRPGSSRSRFSRRNRRTHLMAEAESREPLHYPFCSFSVH